MKYIPNTITILNVFLGLFSMRLIAIGNINAIPIIIIIAAFLDFADGYLARRFNVQTKIGCILDSVSDVICFVIMPSIYVLAIYEGNITMFLIFASLFYLLSGIYRLIRHTFKNLNSCGQDGFFLGCPVTAVAMCVVMALNISTGITFHILLFFICGYLMISRIEYISLSKIINQYNKEVFFLIYLFLFFPFLLFYPHNAIFILSAIYLLFYPLKHLFPQAFISRTPNQNLKKSVINTKKQDWNILFPFAKGARRIVMTSAAALIMSILFLPSFMTYIYAFILLSLAFFFRDPRRTPQDISDSLFLAPADGKVVSVENDFKGEEGKLFKKVSIFLSIFNVHVNRAPIYARILKCKHHEGGNLDARDPNSSNNEHYLYSFQLNSGEIIMMKQLAGKCARRIKSYVTEGSILKTAEKVGVILFGSRVELFLPQDVQINVKQGDIVKAGLTVIAEIPTIKLI